MQENEPRLMIGATAPPRSLAEVTAPHPWVTAARDHLGPSHTMLAATTAVVSHLATEWENNRTADPWLDAGFADLFTRRLRWLTGLVFQPGDRVPSDAETALLVTFPYLHQAFWAKLATATLRGADPAAAAFTSTGELREFSAFAAEDGILHRRGIRCVESGDPAAHSIAWWLFRQWLAGRPECYSTKYITTLLPPNIPEPLNSVLTSARLTELMRVVQIDPAFLRRADRPTRLKPVKHIAGGSEREQRLREQLLGYLLVVAHRAAIDPIALPRDVVDHIGIDDGVVLEEVLNSIRKADWDSTRIRVLTTSCTHPATARALRLHTEAVNSVLVEIAKVAEESEHLKPLEQMPVHASADGITIEPDDDNTHAPASFGHRFQLADDKIQKLLMGEQLYGTPELAIRELYQNALDACRYRRARTDYLVKTGTKLREWSGQINFRQDVDERGRPFLECADNGIGMSDRELIDVFATAGITFAKMPEYREEQADWTAEGIECYPNSRFGVGVLSYFMLADELTVTTCRLNREGRPGRLLKVHIAGPNALFRVRDLGQGTDTDVGTTVRLRLRAMDSVVHCTDLLRRILWISEYLVTSEDASSQQSWQPHQLSPMAPIGSDDALDPDARRAADVIVPVPGGVVWWCDTTGAVLADGIWAGTTQFGAVINLAKADMPRLTVDRKTIIELDHERIEVLLQDSIPALLQEASSPLSHAWLSNLVESMPRIADAICERAIEAGYRPWRIAETDMPIEVVGCFPDDASAMSAEAGRTIGWSNHVGSWRLAAWLAARSRTTSSRVSNEVVPARPSDEILLSTTDRRHGIGRGSLPDDPRPSLGHILSTARQARLSPAEAAERLALLGYATPAPETLPAEARVSDAILLSEHHTGEAPWLPIDKPVAHSHILAAAISAELTPHAVVRRFAELGFEVVCSRNLPQAAHRSDTMLLEPHRTFGELSLGTTVPVAHIMVAAAQSSRTPAEVARRLTELGYTTPASEELPDDHDRHDGVVFIDRPGVYVRNPVPLAHITLTATKTGRSPEQVAARLAQAGFEVPPEDRVPASLRPEDTVITYNFEVNGDRTTTFDVDTVITVGHVLCAAKQTDLSPVQVARRLAELGFTPPPLDHLPNEVEDGDLLMTSSTLGYDEDDYVGPDHWLGVGAAVSVQHIVIAAVKTHRTPRIVRRRLAELGFDCPPEHLLDFDADPDDVILLSLALNGKAPWLRENHPAVKRSRLILPLGHVLAAAAHLGTTPARVADRLAMLGFRAEAAPPRRQVDGLDAKLLNRAAHSEYWLAEHPAEFPWLSATDGANVEHLLIAAAKTGLSPVNVASRLASLGIPTDTPADLPQYVGRDDLTLLSKDLDGNEPFRSLDDEFPRGRVMSVALATRTSPAEVLDRLEQLGIRLGD